MRSGSIFHAGKAAVDLFPHKAIVEKEGLTVEVQSTGR